MDEEVREMERIINMIIDFLTKYSFQIVGAIIVLVAGLIVARYLSGFLLRLCERKKLDPTLSKFVANTVRLLIVGFAFLVAMNKFGITIAPLIAALAATAFGASFAIQGPLANYGAGLVIIVTRTFVLGNTITVAGVSGVVEEIKLGATILTDEDGVRITIPNKHIVGEILFNSEEKRIVEEVIGVSYDSDPEDAIRIIKEILLENEEVPREPPPQVGIQKFNDSSIDIGLRYWVHSKSYFHTLYKTNLAVYKRLKQGGVQIPFPQRDVHIVSQSSGTSESPDTAKIGYKTN